MFSNRGSYSRKYGIFCSPRIVFAVVTPQWISINIMSLQKIYLKCQKECTLNNFQYCIFSQTCTHVCMYICMYVCMYVCMYATSVGTNKRCYHIQYLFVPPLLPPNKAPESVWLPCLLLCLHYVNNLRHLQWINVNICSYTVGWAGCQMGVFKVCKCNQNHFSKWVTHTRKSCHIILLGTKRVRTRGKSFVFNVKTF